MAKKKGNNPKADANNPNTGTKGTNIIWDKKQGKRGADLNPNKKDKSS
jgi:hypothetical protein